jgi:hypothetical protein
VLLLLLAWPAFGSRLHTTPAHTALAQAAAALMLLLLACNGADDIRGCFLQKPRSFSTSRDIALMLLLLLLLLTACSAAAVSLCA